MNEHPSKEIMDNRWQVIRWWATLVVAVIAVPSIGFVVGSFFKHEFLQLIAFVISCWVSTYLGMKVMKLPAMQKPLILTEKKKKD